MAALGRQLLGYLRRSDQVRNLQPLLRTSGLAVLTTREASWFRLGIDFFGVLPNALGDFFLGDGHVDQLLGYNLVLETFIDDGRVVILLLNEVHLVQLLVDEVLADFDLLEQVQRRLARSAEGGLLGSQVVKVDVLEVYRVLVATGLVPPRHNKIFDIFVVKDLYLGAQIWQ